jgi:hypothetical protein
MYRQVYHSALLYFSQKVSFCDFRVFQNKQRLGTAAKVKTNLARYLFHHNMHEWNGHSNEVGVIFFISKYELLLVRPQQ